MQFTFLSFLAAETFELYSSKSTSWNVTHNKCFSIFFVYFNIVLLLTSKDLYCSPLYMTYKQLPATH